MKVLFVALLFVVAGQIIPSCEPRSGELVGFVDDKYLAGGPTGAPVPLIVIGATEYQVPWEFYRQVEIGDLVKNENGRWIIVRKATK